VVVDITVDEDGSGVVKAEVFFDDGVLTWVSDLDQILHLDDVRATGWEIEKSRAEGGLVVRLRKPFASIEQLTPILAEFTGPDGVFGDATLTTGRRGAITEYELDLEIRLETSVEDLIDPAVAGLLDGELFGTPVAELERRAGRPLDQTVSLVVRADIPGGGGRFPDIGTAGLAEGGVFSRVVAGDVMDPEIDAADAAAADARDEVSRGVRIMWLVWVIVGVAAIALLVALRATRRITR